MRKVIFILVGVALLYAGYSFFSGNVAFKNYKVGKTLVVDFSFPDLALEEFSDREKADQARDWLLYSLISNSGLDLKQVAEATFDLAPVRYGFNNMLANFDYGDTRSKFIGDGKVVALIPVSDDKTRNDNIAHILDETRKNQGDKPKKVFVFEYDLNTEGNFARLTRRENLDAGEFFTKKSGYYESPIRNLEDLKSFMEKTDDITFAKNDYNGLVFGGRHLFSQKYGKATPEDVAAIWQSEKYIEENQGKNESSLGSLQSEYEAKIDKINTDYDLAVNLVKFEDGTSFSDLSIDEKNEIIAFIGKATGDKADNSLSDILGSRHKSDRNVAELIAKMKADLNSAKEEFGLKAKKLIKDLKDARVAPSSGFSLDPAVNFQKSIEFVKENRGWFEEALEPPFTTTQLLDQLKENNGDLMQYAIAKIGKGFAGLLLGINEKARKTCLYQKARYDGYLQGTEVGMTLFYTDLLAKLWAANMFNSHPDVSITGFKDLEQTSMNLPVIFNVESDSLPECRLWFGPNKNGFQIAQEKTELAFSRNATQIFALSHNPEDSNSISNTGVKTNIEVQASKGFEVVLNWWNNHYEEVGEFEPQYQRLNEIMKWSTIIGWLNSNDNGYKLEFLSAHIVNRDNWFPDWANAQKDLKFTDWGKITFYPKNTANKTESIPILSSTNEMFEGGVSLAEKTLIKEAPGVLSKEMSVLRRANIAEDFAGGENAFTTFKETRIKLFENVEAKTFNIDIRPKEGFKLRNRFGEIENTRFEWNLAKEQKGGFSFQSKMGDVSIGELRSTPVGKNGFSIGFESRAVDKGMALGKQSSDYLGDMNIFLSKHPEVARYFKSENGEWCVQMKSTDDWMIMRVNAEDAQGTVNLQSGWQARTSGTYPESKIVEMKWVKEAEANVLAGGNLPSIVRTENTLDESVEGLRSRLIATRGEEGAKLELTRIRTERITEANNLSTNGEFERAASEIGKVIRHFGETADLAAMRVRCQLQAGLKALENGDLYRSAKYMNEALTARKASSAGPDILREFDGFINHSNISSAEKLNFQNMAKMYLTDEQMFVAGYWEGYKRLAREVPINEAFTRNGARFIYEDNVAFGHIDPSVSFEATMAQIREIPGVHVYDISAEAIGKNTRMYASVEPKLSSPSTGQKFSYRVSPGSSTGNCKDDDNDGKCDELYTVPGPVYYVSAPSMN